MDISRTETAQLVGHRGRVNFTRVEADAHTMEKEVLTGLRSSPKRISPKYLYDAEGSRLFDRICERELLAAEEVLDKILLSREAEATQLAGGLLMQFRKLASFKRMVAANYESAEAFPKLRIFSKRNQKTYLEGSRQFSASSIETIVQLLVEFDERFRSVKSDLHELLLRLLVYYIVRKAGQGAWQLSL